MLEFENVSNSTAWKTRKSLTPRRPRVSSIKLPQIHTRRAPLVHKSNVEKLPWILQRDFRLPRKNKHIVKPSEMQIPLQEVVSSISLFLNTRWHYGSFFWPNHIIRKQFTAVFSIWRCS